MKLFGKAVPLVALVLAILVDGFFAFINFYPVAPPRSRGPKRVVIAEMTTARARWFQENVLDEFNEEHDTNLQLVVPDKVGLLDALEAARKGGDLTAVVMPSAIALRALRAGSVTPFEGQIPRATIDADFDELRPESLTGAQVDGKQTFLPRGLEVTIALYRISKVHDAFLHWAEARPAIDAALRAANGRGLPEGYKLEENPRRWDSFNRFVVAFYWAHRSYNGFPPRPRVAHPTGDGLDGQLEVSAGIFGAGATAETFGHPDATAAVDYFSWEALYAKERLYLPEMFDKDPLDRAHMITELEAGDTYYTTLELAEAFTLRGGSFYGALTYILDPDDLGWVALPKFSSLELDAAGHPARSAKRFAFRDELVWALPRGGADPKLAYELAKSITTKENHVRECEALGFMPFRKDVFREVTSIFRNYWMSAAFDAATEQWPRSETVPPALVDDKLGSVYAQLWRTIVAPSPGAPLPRDAMLAALRAPPAGLPMPEGLFHRPLPPPPEAAAKPAAFQYPGLHDPVVLDLPGAGATAAPVSAPPEKKR